MMHLADTTLPPCRRRLGDIPRARPDAATCSRQRDAQYPVARRARLVFRSCDANFLEFIRAGFHYSVIVRDGASRAAAGVCLSGPVALKISRRRLRVRLHREMIDGASTRSRQFRLRTGDRRTDAEESKNWLSPMTINARPRRFPDAIR
nr:hypothetical protein [uncultured Rhodopila sp.]